MMDFYGWEDYLALRDCNLTFLPMSAQSDLIIFFHLNAIFNLTTRSTREAI